MIIKNYLIKDKDIIDKHFYSMVKMKVLKKLNKKIIQIPKRRYI